MSLLDEFNATAKTARRGPTCRMGLLLSSLPDSTAGELCDLLGSQAQHTALARFITDKWPDHAMKEGTVSRHRRRECECP